MNLKTWLLGGVGLLALLGVSVFFDGSPTPQQPVPPPMLGGGTTATPDFRTAPPVAEVPSPAPEAPGRLVVDPPTLSLQAVAGETVRATVQVSNAGQAPVAWTASLAGDGAFGLENACPPAGLGPREACLLTVAFRPVRAVAATATVKLQPLAGGGIAVPVAGAASEPSGAAAIETSPSPRDTSARDALRQRRLSGLAQGPGTPPPSDAPRAAHEAYAAQTRAYQTVNSVPEAATDQADYGGYGSYTSSLPVRSCRVVGADSVIEATLTTYIDSAQCGEVRATVNRHVYNSGGDGSCREVLIPAGSSLIGECTAVGGSEERVDVRWRRIIRAGDRAHILIEEAGSDLMGRKGVPGYVDRGTGRALFATVLGAAVNAATGGLVGALDRSTVTSAIDITTGLATSVTKNRTALGEAANAFAQSMGDGISPLVERELERLRAQSQVIVPPGTHIRIVPTTDLWIRSPGQGPLVMTEAARGEAGPGARLNPQFQPNGAVGVGSSAPLRSPATFGRFDAARGAAAPAGVVQQSGASVQPGQSVGLAGAAAGSAASVQRVRPGASW